LAILLKLATIIVLMAASGLFTKKQLRQMTLQVKVQAHTQFSTPSKKPNLALVEKKHIRPVIIPGIKRQAVRGGDRRSDLP